MIYYTLSYCFNNSMYRNKEREALFYYNNLRSVTPMASLLSTNINPKLTWGTRVRVIN